MHDVARLRWCAVRLRRVSDRRRLRRVDLGRRLDVQRWFELRRFELRWFELRWFELRRFEHRRFELHRCSRRLALHSGERLRERHVHRGALYAAARNAAEHHLLYGAGLRERDLHLRNM